MDKKVHKKLTLLGNGVGMCWESSRAGHGCIRASTCVREVRQAKTCPKKRGSDTRAGKVNGSSHRVMQRVQIVSPVRFYRWSATSRATDTRVTSVTAHFTHQTWRVAAVKQKSAAQKMCESSPKVAHNDEFYFHFPRCISSTPLHIGCALHYHRQCHHRPQSIIVMPLITIAGNDVSSRFYVLPPPMRCKASWLLVAPNVQHNTHNLQRRTTSVAVMRYRW